jgi:hypothetical protein
LFPADQPDLFFESNTIGRLKKEGWKSRDEQIDAIPAEDGVPAPMEGSGLGSYTQTTVRKLRTMCNRQPT